MSVSNGSTQLRMSCSLAINRFESILKTQAVEPLCPHRWNRLKYR